MSRTNRLYRTICLATALIKGPISRSFGVRCAFSHSLLANISITLYCLHITEMYLAFIVYTSCYSSPSSELFAIAVKHPHMGTAFI